MTQNSGFYWGKAHECHRLAKNAADPWQKSSYENKARAWTEIAEKIDADNQGPSDPVSATTYYERLMDR